MMADILGMPIRIHQFKHTCALGAAMFAAVVASGIYPTVEEAMDSDGARGFDVEYQPDTPRTIGAILCKNDITNIKAWANL